jgi:hypothetical protein
MPRLHGLRLPDSTACNVVGRLLSIGDGKAIAQGDRLYRIARAHHAIDCEQCLKRLLYSGAPLNWHDVPSHAASIAKEKRRRRRRRIVSRA